VTYLYVFGTVIQVHFIIKPIYYYSVVTTTVTTTTILLLLSAQFSAMHASLLTYFIYLKLRNTKHNDRANDTYRHHSTNNANTKRPVT